VSQSLTQIASYLGGLAAYLRNLGAEVPEPVLDRYDSGEIGFEITAQLPGSDGPKPALITAQEIWRPAEEGRFERSEYGYDLIDYPANRRRAFHMHDVSEYLSRLGVTAHEHCEEVLGKPTCDRYLGLPVYTGYDGLNALLACWSDPGPLGCAGVRCAR
jgi:hypothetical protein